MTGVTHKKVGVATAVTSMSFLMFADSDFRLAKVPVYLCMIPLAAFAAVLPDIDMRNSEMGKKRVMYLTYIGATGMSVSVFALLAILYRSSKVLGSGFSFSLMLEDAVLKNCMFLVAGGMTLIFIPLLLGTVIDNWKHRHETHSLTALGIVSIPLVFLSGTPILFYLVLGFSVGYGSHILADMFNTKGVALVSPFNESMFGWHHVIPFWRGIVTGSKAESGFCTMYMAVCGISSLVLMTLAVLPLLNG